MIHAKFTTYATEKSSATALLFSVSISVNGEKTLEASIEDVNGLFSESNKGRDKAASLQDLTIESPAFMNDDTQFTEVGSYDTTREADLRSLLDILQIDSIDIESELSTNKDENLIIESNFHSVLSLPWEVLASTGKRLKIVRRVTNSNIEVPKSSGDNYIFLLSHSYQDGFNRLDKISEDYEKETQLALSALFSMQKGYFKPQLLTILRYLNPDALQAFDINAYSTIHLMLHGRENGDIAFEQLSDHAQIEWIDTDDVIKLLGGKKRDLIFLSCCYSGYGDASRASLAHELVRAGAAKGVVGFSGGIGSENTLPQFVNDFYEYYTINKNTEDSFHQAVDKLIQIRSPYWQKPILYMENNA